MGRATRIGGPRDVGGPDDHQQRGERVARRIRARAEGHDQRHRRARRRVQGRGVVRAQRPPGTLGRDAEANPGDREGAALVPEPRRPLSFGGARRRLRPRARPPREDARDRDVLHGVHRRRRVGAGASLDRADHPAGRRPTGRDRRLPALVGRASRRRSAPRRPARRRPALRRARAAWPAGGRGRRTVQGSKNACNLA